ncbi:hypothetical protein VDIAB_250182 [Vibrio diabolicus]|nr:hypothetical protein VDIAB_250182 [Vibrio diabolicus]
MIPAASKESLQSNKLWSVYPYESRSVRTTPTLVCIEVSRASFLELQTSPFRLLSLGLYSHTASVKGVT